MGFEEVQFDYIRFPEPYPSLPKQVFPGQDIPKPDALAEFLKQARTRLHALGARSTADIFGLVTSGGTLEVGQNWDRISPNVDVVLPMTYPSHYPSGNYGLKHPNGEPYAVLLHAAGEARARDAKLGVANAVNHVRPWLQAFTLGAPHYGPEQLDAQKRGVYDAGYESWTLWSPGSKYDEFLPGLEKGETVSHRKQVAAR